MAAESPISSSWKKICAMTEVRLRFSSSPTTQATSGVVMDQLPWPLSVTPPMPALPPSTVGPPDAVTSVGWKASLSSSFWRSLAARARQSKACSAEPFGPLASGSSPVQPMFPSPPKSMLKPPLAYSVTSDRSPVPFT